MWLERKYIGIISGRLEKFKQVNQKLWNFRCPICGDSSKHAQKARGYIFEKDDGHFLYHCHNCNVTMDVDRLLQQLDPSTHKQYVIEKLKEKYEPKKEREKRERAKSDVEIFAEKMKPPKFISATALKHLKKISQLKHDHPAKQYVVNRQIPNPWHSKLFYAPRFKEFVNKLVPGKFDKDSLTREQPRLIIPFLDEDKNLIGFQGRAFDSLGIKYITIMLDDTAPKLFNLDQCKRDTWHYVFEGPIDAMFLNNTLAMAGGSFPEDYINEYTVFVWDNEPRHKDTLKKIEKTIKKGHNVAFFPDKYMTKDVNDMVLKEGADPYTIERELRFNTHQGLSAEMKLADWRKL